VHERGIHIVWSPRRPGTGGAAAAEALPALRFAAPRRGNARGSPAGLKRRGRA